MIRTTLLFFLFLIFTPSILLTQNNVDRGRLIKMDNQSFDSVLALSELNKSSEIDSVIITEFKRLSRLDTFHIPLRICNEGSIFSHPTEGIILSRKEMENIFKNSNVTQFRSIIALILAHEYAHQIQFIKYGSNMILNANNQIKKIYECQADIWAGNYLIDSVEINNFEEKKKSIKEALTVLFDLGTEEFSLSNDHPSHENRRTAVRIGMAHGMISNFKTNIADPNCPQQIKELSKSSIEVLSKKIELSENEDIWDWSYKKSEEITNYCQICSDYLVLESQSIKYNTDKNSPIVHYDLSYKNTSDYSMKIKLEVQSVTASLDDIFDSMDWQKWDSRIYSINMLPQQTYTISDEQTWNQDNDSQIPMLIFTPSPSSLISIDCSSCNEKGFASKNFSKSSKLLLDSNSINPNSELTLNKLIGAVDDNFRKLLIGPIRTNRQSMIYQSSIQYPQSYKTEICFDVSDSTTIMSAICYIGNNLRKATEKFEKHITLIEKTLQNNNLSFKKKKIDSNSINQIQIISSELGIRCSVKINKNEDLFVVEVTMSKI